MTLSQRKAINMVIPVAKHPSYNDLCIGVERDVHSYIYIYIYICVCVCIGTYVDN